MKTYTVVAVYEDDFARFAESYEAETPQDSIRKALVEHPDLIIAGVIEGDPSPGALRAADALGKLMRENPKRVITAREVAHLIDRETHAAELAKALSGLLEDYEAMHGVGICDCRHEPENRGHVCNACKARQLLGISIPDE